MPQGRKEIESRKAAMSQRRNLSVLAPWREKINGRRKQINREIITRKAAKSQRRNP